MLLIVLFDAQLQLQFSGGRKKSLVFGDFRLKEALKDDEKINNTINHNQKGRRFKLSPYFYK